MRQNHTMVFFGWLLAACASKTQVLAPESPEPVAARAVRATAHVDAKVVPPVEEQPMLFSHAAGDYIVRRFWLRTRHVPTVLTERVIAVKQASIVLEVTRETGAVSRSVRVELGNDPANRGEVLGAAALVNGREIAMGKAAYSAIMRDTIFAADENDGAIESVRTKLDLQGRVLDCTETRFRVKVRGRVGTMRTIELENSPWGEVAGDVTTADGAVLYRAEVVDVGHDELRTAAAKEN
jgi:hypothetical protein